MRRWRGTSTNGDGCMSCVNVMYWMYYKISKQTKKVASCHQTFKLSVKKSCLNTGTVMYHVYPSPTKVAVYAPARRTGQASHSPLSPYVSLWHRGMAFEYNVHVCCFFTLLRGRAMDGLFPVPPNSSSSPHPSPEMRVAKGPFIIFQQWVGIASC